MRSFCLSVFSFLCFSLLLVGCDKSNTPGQSTNNPASQSANAEADKNHFYGHFTRNERRMDIRDYHQMWDKDAAKLTLVLTPARLSDEQKAAIEANKHFAIGAFSNSPSPDPALWADWYPLVLIELHFAGPEISLDTLKHYQLVASRIEVPEYTESFGGMPDEHIRIDQLDFVSGRLVGLHFMGSKRFYEGSPYEANESWQIILY